MLASYRGLHSDLRPSGGETSVPHEEVDVNMPQIVSDTAESPAGQVMRPPECEACTTRDVNWPRRNFAWWIAHVQMGSASERCRRTGRLVKCLTFSCPGPSPEP